MPDILENDRIKTIAFYLPQFHRIPENDDAWGKGFTEWTNVKKAEPLFEGHYQPRVPLGRNYYDLSDKQVLEEQSKTALEYGVWGFCYYHYWFGGGKKLLEKPVENMLRNEAVTIPYCLCWANENWTKKWDGGSSEIIAKQNYGTQQDWEKHFLYLIDFFRDKRYITLKGKPVLLIYRPAEIPCLQDMLVYWEKRSRESGLGGICFMVQNGSAYFDPRFEMGRFDYQVKFEPFFFFFFSGKKNWEKKKRAFSVMRKLHILNGVHKLYMKSKKNTEVQAQKTEQTVFDYDGVWSTILQKNPDDYLVEGACVDWDNTPRTRTGFRMEGAAPEKFGKYMSLLVRKIRDNRELPLIFINAWNEWGEGAYLEPDEKYGYSYLEELKKASDE